MTCLFVYAIVYLQGAEVEKLVLCFVLSFTGYARLFPEVTTIKALLSR